MILCVLSLVYWARDEFVIKREEKEGAVVSGVEERFGSVVCVVA